MILDVFVIYTFPIYVRFSWISIAFERWPSLNPLGELRIGLFATKQLSRSGCAAKKSNLKSFRFSRFDLKKKHINHHEPTLPSGDLSHFAMENHHFSWENPLFQWQITIFHGKIHYKSPFSIAFSMFTRPGPAPGRRPLGRSVALPLPSQWSAAGWRRTPVLILSEEKITSNIYIYRLLQYCNDYNYCIISLYTWINIYIYIYMYDVCKKDGIIMELYIYHYI